MTDTRLTRVNFTGPWAGLPVAWTDAGQFDEDTYRADVIACCRAGVPGVYTGGTTGEFYAQGDADFAAIARTTIEECHRHDRFAMIGCTAASTRLACRRAEQAVQLGADAIQLALPYWLEVPEHAIVPYFQAVSTAAGHLPLSVYDTSRARRLLTLEQHRQIHDTLPNYVMVKATGNAIGTSPQGCQALSEHINVFTSEHLWHTLAPFGVRGACSAAVYWNPRIVLDLWQNVATGNQTHAQIVCARLTQLVQFLVGTLGPRGYTDSAFDRVVARATGFLHTSLHMQPPYPSPTPDEVTEVRHWLEANYPEMLDLE